MRIQEESFHPDNILLTKIMTLCWEARGMLSVQRFGNHGNIGKS